MIGLEDLKESYNEIGESTISGTHPMTQGIGGPATKGASLIKNAPRLASAVTGGTKARKAAKSVDAGRRLASAGTVGENPVDKAKDAADAVRDLGHSGRERLTAEIPDTGDSPEPTGSVAPILLGGAAVAAILIGGDYVGS